MCSVRDRHQPGPHHGTKLPQVGLDLDTQRSRSKTC